MYMTDIGARARAHALVTVANLQQSEDWATQPQLFCSWCEMVSVGARGEGASTRRSTSLFDAWRRVAMSTQARGAYASQTYVESSLYRQCAHCKAFDGTAKIIFSA